MLTLSLLKAYWLDAPNPLDDQCAHGTVLFSAGEQDLVTPQDGQLTVSAAALNLLRTIEHDHTSESPVSEGGQLFPCCGFNVWVAGERFPVLILGCQNGADIELVHIPSGVALRSGGSESVVSEEAWRSAVVSFAESVLAFYDREPPRNPVEDTEDRKGWQAFWQAFWQEYVDRLQRHRVVI